MHIHEVALQNVAPEVYEAIIRDFPQYDKTTQVPYSLVLEYRLRSIEGSLPQKQHAANMSKVMQTIRNHKFISEKQHDREKLSPGQKAADAIARFGGSWGFIGVFFLFLLGWIVLNTTSWLFPTFDSYPFILLNLGLSCLAAIQAPIILMSQNRQAENDRMQAENDYEVNLKSEIEIRLLHDKIDHLLNVDLQKISMNQDKMLEHLHCEPQVEE